MKKSLLRIQNVSFSYDYLPVLRQVNVEVRQGEFIGVFGPNGGGKTTLLKLILGFLQPQEGTLFLLDGRPEQTRHSVGYVPQVTHFDRDFPITVLEVVLMGALQRLNWLGRYPSEVKKAARDALERVGLEKKARALFGSLSGGEAQRALIARAILNHPQLLILDEPTAHIDPEGGIIIHKLLEELNHTMGIVMVTHDLQTILHKTTRLLCVQTRVMSMKPSEICEHFALGLYHVPLKEAQHIKGPFPC